MEIVKIGLDLGNSMLKATTYKGSKRLRAKMPNRLQYGKTINPKAKKIEFNRTTVFIGAGELNNNVQKHTRKHLLEQTFAMVDELFKTEKDLKIDLNVGLPPVQYFNDSYKKQFEDIFPIGKTLEYSINGNQKRITIIGLTVCVEGYSAFVSNVDSIGDNKQDVLSIDVGGGTTDCCNYIYDYDDEMYYPNDTLTIPVGIIDFTNEIANHFNEVENADVSSAYIDSLLKNNKYHIEYKGNKYPIYNYLNALDTLVYDITNKITNEFGAFDRYIVLGSGGGYKTFNRMVKEQINKEVELDEESQFFGNSDGYLIQ